MTLDWLTYFPSPARGVWHLGPIPIRAYALCIIVGIVAALLIGDRRWRARGGEPGVIYDIALWAVPFGLIGGRLYHLMTDWRTYFGEGGAGWEATPRIWDGGLGIWGAVALGGVGAWIGCRRRGIPLPAFGDAVAPGIVLAQAIGRVGNYFNQELYGRETTLPWGLEIFWREDAAGIRDPHLLDGVSTGELYKIVQPTFLYELLWNLVVFAVLIYADRRFRMGHGRLFALYVAGYCIGRFGVELLRDDAATHIAGIRVNSFTSTFVFIGAVVYILLASKGREDPEVLRRAWQPGEPEQPPAEAEPDTEHEAEAEAEQELVTVATAANGVGSVVRIPERFSSQAESVDAEADAAAQTPEAVDAVADNEGIEATEDADVVEGEDVEDVEITDVAADELDEVDEVIEDAVTDETGDAKDDEDDEDDVVEAADELDEADDEDDEDDVAGAADELDEADDEDDEDDVAGAADELDEADDEEPEPEPETEDVEAEIADADEVAEVETASDSTDDAESAEVSEADPDVTDDSEQG